MRDRVADVEGAGKKDLETTVVDEEEDEDEDEDEDEEGWEEVEEEENIRDVPIEDRQPREEKRPTL